VQGLARSLRLHSGWKRSLAEQKRTEPNRTAWVVRSSTNAPFVPVQLSWQPNPFCPIRVPLVASCRLALVARTERLFRRITHVASRSLWGTLYIHDVAWKDWPDPLGLILTASRIDSAWKTNLRYEMEALTLHAKPSRIEPDRAWPSVFTGLCLLITRLQ